MADSSPGSAARKSAHMQGSLLASCTRFSAIQAPLSGSTSTPRTTFQSSASALTYQSTLRLNNAPSRPEEPYMHAFHAVHDLTFAPPIAEQVPFLCAPSSTSPSPATPVRSSGRPFGTDYTLNMVASPLDQRLGSPRKSRKRKHDENDPPHRAYAPSTPSPAYPAHLDTDYSYTPFPSTIYEPPLYPYVPPTNDTLPTLPSGAAETPAGRPLKRKYHREAAKVGMLLRFLRKELNWTLGDLLQALFDFGEDVHREEIHAAAVSSFLQGSMKTTPAHIVDLWFRHPDGRLSQDGPEHRELYSTDGSSFMRARGVRVALTCFAVKTVLKRVAREAEEAIAPENGLHASRKRKKNSSDTRPPTVQWADIGAATVPRASRIIAEFQPVLSALLLAVAKRRLVGPEADQEGLTRIHRPAELVVSEAISNLNFTRSNRANLIPLARGLLHFALSAPFDVFRYQSRIGAMPAYTTVLGTLDALATQEAEEVRAHGKDATTAKGFIGDNIQNYLQQRDACLGRVNTLITGMAATYVEYPDCPIEALNTLITGMAATYVEYPDCPIEALDLDDRQRRITQNLRSKLTVEKLFSLIDQRHVETVGVLLLLRTLTKHVPELNRYQHEVSIRYRSRAAKLPLPPKPTRVHPLGTSSKNETVTTDLKDGIVDFLGQAGQERERYNRQLFLFCGDGLTFEKLVTLKYYLRDHADPFESLAVIEPVLAPWHTVWTDLSRVFQRYWGSLLSKDPSTLGFSAAKIGLRAPSNINKPDFNEAFQAMETIHDAHILDCFRVYYKSEVNVLNHFAKLYKDKQLPSFEQLEKDARDVYRAFCTRHSGERALDFVGDLPKDSDEHPNTRRWKDTVPLGSDQWSSSPAPTVQSTALSSSSSGQPSSGLSSPSTSPSSSSSATEPNATRTSADQLPSTPSTSEPDVSLPAPADELASQSPTSKDASESSKGAGDPEPFLGDRVLANAIDFMAECITIREFLYACAEGDPGRVYEAMKVMLFTFAGSDHSKYTLYLLEFICVLEFESSAALREAILKSLLVNLSGNEGSFSPADLIQEYFNRLLQAIAERKGVEYNQHFIRHTVSRNLHHLARLRDDLNTGVGLKERSGRHCKPKRAADIAILLDEYQRHELHSRCPGRTFVSIEESHKVSDFRQGIANLRSGKLAKWITESLFMRGTPLEPLATRAEPSRETSGASSGPDEELVDGEEDEDGEYSAASTLPSLRMVDGQLVVEQLNLEDADIDDLWQAFQDDEGIWASGELDV